MLGRPPQRQSIGWLARIALVCGIAAPLLLQLSRWVVNSASHRPSDDTLFLFTMAAPGLAAIGLALALVARLRDRNGVVTAALLLNGVWLALFLFGIADFTATFRAK